MKLNNINGTSDRTCSCGTWLDHWKNFSGMRLPTCCPETFCVQEPEVGAHVQRDDATDKNWYIVPLCKKHNAETGKSITVSHSVGLVSANVKETCGK
jgi:hypothetical protein